MLHHTFDRHLSNWAVGNFPALTCTMRSCLQVVNGTKLSENFQDKDVCQQGTWQLPLPPVWPIVSSMFLPNYCVYIMMLKAVFLVRQVYKLLTWVVCTSMLHQAFRSCLLTSMYKLVHSSSLLNKIDSATPCMLWFGVIWLNQVPSQHALISHQMERRCG